MTSIAPYRQGRPFFYSGLRIRSRLYGISGVAQGMVYCIIGCGVAPRFALRRF